MVPVKLVPNDFRESYDQELSFVLTVRFRFLFAPVSF